MIRKFNGVMFTIATLAAFAVVGALCLATGSAIHHEWVGWVLFAMMAALFAVIIAAIWEATLDVYP